MSSLVYLFYISSLAFIGDIQHGAWEIAVGREMLFQMLILQMVPLTLSAFLFTYKSWKHLFGSGYTVPSRVLLNKSIQRNR